MFRLARYSAMAAAVLLAACGGGGDSDGEDTPPPPAPVTSSAEGFWVGKSSTGWDVSLAILENGESWGVYQYNGILYGALHGATTSSNGNLSGSGAEVNFATGAVATSAYQGSYTPKSSLNLQTQSGVTFSGAYASVYDQPASLTTLAGTYTGSGVATGAPVQSAVVTVSASGAINSPPSLGCSASGTVKPRASGKNVFDLSLTWNGANCSLGNGTVVSGVVYYENGRLIAMGLKSGSQTDGFIFTGRK